MRELKVDLGDRSYPIRIGHGLLSESRTITSLLPDRQIMIVTNHTVEALYLPELISSLPGYTVEICILPEGEEYKTLDTMSQIITHLLTAGFNRDASIIALGGGVIGDISGFAAASYQRGVRFLQVPTTLLAQVDSSVGGKTGVNHVLGTNMIGAFYQPAGVISDVSTLDTLPQRELQAGLAEVIKYGLIRDAEFFDWLEMHTGEILDRQTDALIHAVERSCVNKTEVVKTDERESGLRAILNFGHTFGHAIETGLNYSGLLHGEAVAVGMIMAADLSRRTGLIGDAEVERINNLVRKAGLPDTMPPNVDADRLQRCMAVDKKVRAGRQLFILLNGIGKAVIRNDVRASDVRATIRQFAR